MFGERCVKDEWGEGGREARKDGPQGLLGLDPNECESCDEQTHATPEKIHGDFR